LKRKEIDLVRLRLPAVGAWKDRWFLLAAGDYTGGSWNVMTVAWGGLGCMWKKPLAMIVVRPTRYTYEFLGKHPDFTLSQLPESLADKANFCGSHSGRDTDKMKATGLTPIASTQVAAPGFAEAELILECRKMYFDNLEPAQFLAGHIEANYPQKDYHRMYFGEILAAFGTDAYQG